MKFWNKIKQFVRRRAEENAQIDITRFILEKPYGFEVPAGLKTRNERLAYKRNLTANYTYQAGDDLLARKQDFIDQYTINEQKQYNYFVKDDPLVDEFSTRAWCEHEQAERLCAQKAWRTVVKRNYHTHMRQKFMNQKALERN